jgi:probable rRNA maturation factor
MITLDFPATKNGPGPLRLPALRAFLQRAQRAAGLAGQTSVLLTTDRALRRLNREFRGKDRPTDVLSFPPLQAPGAGTRDHGAGDLAISLETAARQARSLGHTLETEVRVLILHGLLHLAGLDHETDSGEMAAREESLRRRFRLPTALIARNTHPRARRAPPSAKGAFFQGANGGPTRPRPAQ